MKILIAAATEQEISPLRERSGIDGIKLHYTITGIGILAAGIRLTQAIHEQKPDLVIQAGIAGAYDKSLVLGSVVVVKEEFLADLGVEENGEWKDIFDLKLSEDSVHPFQQKGLRLTLSDKFNLTGLPEVTSVTINEITTRKERIQEIIKKYNPAIESMEGAALHYACIVENLPFIQVRSISNYIGERDKSKWKIGEAIKNLNNVVYELVNKISKTL
jgi:futalosine hydrolase